MSGGVGAGGSLAPASMSRVKKVDIFPRDILGGSGKELILGQIHFVRLLVRANFGQLVQRLYGELPQLA